MGIKIAEINNSGKKLVPIRRLMVQENGKNVEKYRVVCGGKLIYGKCKISFDLNWPILGDGKTHPYTEVNQQNSYYYIPKNVYAFYEDGFYQKRKRTNGLDDWFFKYADNLMDIVKIEPWWAKEFQGWYTAKDGGTKITEISKLNDFFKKSDKSSIILYAHWVPITFTIHVHNVKFYYKPNKDIYSKTSFVYNKQRTSKDVSFSNVLVYTDIISYVNKRITKPKYVTWGNYYLDDTNNANKLRAGPQKFLGWQIFTDTSRFRRGEQNSDYVEGIYNSFTVVPGDVLFPSNIHTEGPLSFDNNVTFHVYPCFQVLVILDKAKLNNGRIVGGKYFLLNLPRHPEYITNHYVDKFTLSDIRKRLKLSDHWRIIGDEGFYTQNNSYRGYSYSSTIVLAYFY